MLYANEVGGQDELVFDGASFAINADRSLAVQLPPSRRRSSPRPGGAAPSGWTCDKGTVAAIDEGDEADYQACVLGLRDYVEKNRFPGVVLGLSGGIDSAIVAAMAVDALGPERVHCVMLPFRYTSQDIAAGRQGLRRRLSACATTSCRSRRRSRASKAVLAPLFAGRPRDITEENMQSRIRGTILMSISNKFGSMVVTTGNKSEMSVGYATLYGDMNGGFNPDQGPLQDRGLPARGPAQRAGSPPTRRGRPARSSPTNILTKAPTAELRENQKDQDSLPPYDVLDDILECLVEREMRVAEIVARGHDEATVRKIERLLYLAEYKRRQAAPGVKVTEKNFGRDRRYPITNRFRDLGGAAFRADEALYRTGGKTSADLVDF